jgi:hypothetical protein
MIVRQVFPGWSIAIPAAFREAFMVGADSFEASDPAAQVR